MQRVLVELLHLDSEEGLVDQVFQPRRRPGGELEQRKCEKCETLPPGEWEAKCL
jgi:hypothetical protein